MMLLLGTENRDDLFIPLAADKHAARAPRNQVSVKGGLASIIDESSVISSLTPVLGILGQALYLEAEAAGVRGTGIGCYFDDAVHDLLGLNGQALQSLYHFTVGGALSDTRLQTLPAYAHLKRS